MLFLRPVHPPTSSPLQQSAHAREGTEQVEVAILKTCQSISELRREVSPRLCPLNAGLLSKRTQGST